MKAQDRRVVAGACVLTDGIGQTVLLLGGGFSSLLN